MKNAVIALTIETIQFVLVSVAVYFALTWIGFEILPMPMLKWAMLIAAVYYVAGIIEYAVKYFKNGTI